MIGTLDSQVIEKFKEFQNNTGKYLDLNIEDIEFDKKMINDIIDEFIKGSTPKYSQRPTSTIAIKSGQARGNYNKFDFKNTAYLDLTQVKNPKYLQNGDILINTTGVGTAGRVTLFDLSGRYVSDSHITALRYDLNRFDKFYLLYFFVHYGFKKLEAMAEGSGGQVELSMEKIKPLVIPIPKDYNEKYKSIGIQKSIVEFLEFWKIHYTDVFRQTVNHQKPLIEKIKKVLISATLKHDKTMVNSFNEFVSNKGFHFKLDEIKFENTTLGNIIDLIGGDRITKKNNSGTIYPVYGGGDISFKTDTYNRENEYVIGRFAISETCVRFVNKKFHLLDSGFTFKIKDNFEEILDKNFIGYFLLSIQYKIYACAKGSGQKNLDIRLFNKIDFLFPKDKNIQSLLVEFWEIILNNIDKRFTKFDNIERLADKADEAFLYRTFSKIEWSEE